TLLVEVRRHRGVRQPQRVPTALQQEIAALDHRHAALGRTREQEVDVDVVGELDPEEVTTVGFGEPYPRNVLAQRAGEQPGAFGQRGVDGPDGTFEVARAAELVHDRLRAS